MSKSRFSSNFLSLQLQLKTILEEAGGDDLMPFLDTLSSINKSEQRVALKLFKRTLDKFVGGSMRLETQGDLALKEFEDSLFSDLLEDISTARHPKNSSKAGAKLKISRSLVEDSSGSQAAQSPIDLSAERARRKAAPPEILPAS